MATAFMRWLETRPGDYDRGIRLLTLGRLAPLQRRMIRAHIQPGWELLEIGCGTGMLSLMLAEAGASVVAIDRSQAMLEVARQRFGAAGVSDHIRLLQMEAARIGERFAPASFDGVLSSLAFSEMGIQEQRYVLRAVRRLIKPGGVLLILDESQPARWLAAVAARILRLPLRVLTWLLTRTTTQPLGQRFDDHLLNAGFEICGVHTALAGMLQGIHARPVDSLKKPSAPIPNLGSLRAAWSLKKAFIEAWALFFRILPPYPQQEPGLYSIGTPGPHSPVLVTGNYQLTVQRVVRAIDGEVDAWLLVANSDGINVWCGAGGGFLTAERVLAAWRVSALDQFMLRKVLVLPQLCANGVDGWKVREDSGWEVRWGPVKARQIPGYLRAGMTKSDDMRLVSFPLVERLEMMAATLGFYALLILLPVAIFWRSLLLPLTLSLVGLSTFYAIGLHWLPGRDGLEKSFPLAGFALFGLLAYSALLSPLPEPGLFTRAVGLVALSVFVAAELQGMSPEMRGEQANWGWEAFLALVLGLVYWLVPLILGWR